MALEVDVQFLGMPRSAACSTLLSVGPLVNATIPRQLRHALKASVPAWVAQRRLGRKRNRSILLTFDDGPHPDFTPAVLSSLERFGARAVFFVVGREAERRPDLLREIVERGHRLGNHSYSHPNDRVLPYRAYLQDLIRCQAVIANAIGRAPRAFRPPLGILSLAGFAASRALRLRCTLWSIEGGEWGDHRSEDSPTTAARLLHEVAPGDILLLHDNHPRVPEVLDRLLPELAKRGDDLVHAVELFD